MYSLLEGDGWLYRGHPAIRSRPQASVKNLALFFSFVLVFFPPIASVCRGEDRDATFTKQVADVLAECKKITPGMTRADLLKVFTTEGGLSTAAQRTFVYRGCPYIKVEVEFKIDD